MYDFVKTFGIFTDSPASCSEIFGNVRISILTPSLIRVENQPDGKFCDLPTQTVICRSFDSPAYSISCDKTAIFLKTEKAEFTLKNGKLVKVCLNDGRTVTDFHKGNLRGTRRTLDMTFGRVRIGEGIISRSGVALLDDSSSLVLMSDGTLKPRKNALERKSNGTDIYCFAYGDDYNGAIRDYYKLCGSTPLIPRFALGNWWSRYKAYTQQEYLELMDRFKSENIPVTVATVDMDWHYTDIAERFGKDAAKCKTPKNPYTYLTGCYLIPGWTGYTWNEELFPDYRQFLKKLQNDNYKVTLNLHPAQGVRCFEAAYGDFAKFMGIDPESKQPIEFDISDPKFIQGYFRFLHHIYEDEGVDFWWLDWQQEKHTKIDGLDPLWALNHYHSLDVARDGKKRPLILSRFAGCGSHRYPLGFSGDTAINWATLKFQPYFTATASNIGYSWWSHDIGGHHYGRRDDELYLRWVQFGVFSPIMRLHSSKNEFIGKEPWKYGDETYRVVTDFMRLRHRLIPYLYTMNRRTNYDGIPLIRPMYYDYPKEKDAYTVGNEYFFGSELIVCPITEKADKRLNLGGAEVWLPQGKYTDIFTGRVYAGGTKLRMFRGTNSIPVLAKEGAIIPLSANGTDNNCKNPTDMEILIFSGNGEFRLYEDDGETEKYKNGEFSQTLFSVSRDNDTMCFSIEPVEGDASLVPEQRNYLLSFGNIADAEIECSHEHTAEKGQNFKLSVSVKSSEKLTVTLKNIKEKKNPPKREMLTELICKIQGNNDLKSLLYSKCLTDEFDGKIASPKAVREAINEIMCML